MSEFDLFPDNSSVPTIPNVFKGFTLELVGFLFLGILLGTLYFQYLVIPRLFDFVEGSDQVETDLFIRPSISAAQLKRQKKREKMLRGFKWRVDQIVDESKKILNEDGANPMIVYAYHQLDEAFFDFAKLRRSKDLTPLEHVQMHFQTGEINYQSLKSIVELFYRVRFAKRNLDLDEGRKFLEHLDNLVEIDIIPGESD